MTFSELLTYSRITNPVIQERQSVDVDTRNSQQIGQGASRIYDRHRRVLLAVDESQDSEAAVHQLMTEANPRETAILVLHVIEPLPLYPNGYLSSGAECGSMRRKQWKEAKSLIVGVAEQLRTAGFTPTTMLRRGDPVGIILKVAKEWCADLIILGSHERNWMDRLLLRSVSDAVVRRAICTVEVAVTKKVAKS